MASQTLGLDTKYTSTIQLDGYLKGIKDEFNLLNLELEETRKERDEYKIKYTTKAKELRQIRQTIRACLLFTNDSDDPSPLISPISSPSSEYYPCFEGEEPAVSGRLGIGQLGEENSQQGDEVRESANITVGNAFSLESNVTPTNEPVHSPWDIEFQSDTTATLNLKLVHNLTHKGRIIVAFNSMDGKYLATATSLKGIVTTFDTKTGERISVMKTLHQPEGKDEKKDEDEPSWPAYECLGFSSDSKYLATGEFDGTVRIWAISQLEKPRVRNVFQHGIRVNDLIFSSNGRCIATCAWDGKVRIWRLRDGFLRVLIGLESIPLSVRFSTEGRFIASGG